MAMPLHAGENKSPNTPPVFVTGALAKKAPKNRVSISVCRSLAVALAKLKQLATNMGAMTATRRPNTSLSGAHSRGPTPKPKRNSVVPSVATCVPTPNSRAICSVPAEYADDAHVADMVTKPYSSVVVTFLRVGQLSGWYGSSLPSKSTISASDVATWASGCVNCGTALRERMRERTVSRRVMVRASGCPPEPEAAPPGAALPLLSAAPVALAIVAAEGALRQRLCLLRERDSEAARISCCVGRWPSNSWCFSSGVSTDAASSSSSSSSSVVVVLVMSSMRSMSSSGCP